MQKPLLPVLADKLPRLKGGGIGPRKETCVNSGGSITLVPCVHQGKIYIKRQPRVWRVQKCIPLVGAKTPLTCVGRQTTPSQGRRYRDENGNLRKLGIYRIGTVFAPKQYLYQKPLLSVLAVKLPRLKGGGKGPRTETCTNLGGSIAMVPCLHQGYIYIKRELGVWRVQKCIPLVGE